MTTLVKPDPIFAAIERHRQRENALIAFNAAMDRTAPLEEQFAHEEQAVPLIDSEEEEYAALLSTTPTTPAGVAALLRYVEFQENKNEDIIFGFADGVRQASAGLFSRIAATLEAI